MGFLQRIMPRAFLNKSRNGLFFLALIVYDMYMKKNQMLMTSGTIWKQMLLFAFPVFLGNLFQQLYNTAVSLIVGNYLEVQALRPLLLVGN